MNIPTSLARLVKMLEQNLAKDEKLSPLKAKEIVLAANVQVEDMQHYADFNHPVEDCYGRQMVYDGGRFEVMVMSWKPGDYSSIHNHGYTEWGVVQVFGNTHHFIYNLQGEDLSFARKEILTKGSAIKVNNSFIHQMGNATSTPYLTLHVYGANQRDSDITADAQNFDLEYERIVHTCGGAFFNLPEEAVHELVGRVRPTQAVFLHYAYLLMDYYNRQKPSKKITALKRQLLAKLNETVFAVDPALN
jgi:predicted metal-dependent enzyme (double-stranded beta helix superfamily)